MQHHRGFSTTVMETNIDRRAFMQSAASSAVAISALPAALTLTDVIHAAPSAKSLSWAPRFRWQAIHRAASRTIQRSSPGPLIATSPYGTSFGRSFDETITFVKPADGETVTYADCRNGPPGPSNWLGSGDFE